VFCTFVKDKRRDVRMRMGPQGEIMGTGGRGLNQDSAWSYLSLIRWFYGLWSTHTVQRDIPQQN